MLSVGSFPMFCVEGANPFVSVAFYSGDLACRHGYFLVVVLVVVGLLSAEFNKLNGFD